MSTLRASRSTPNSFRSFLRPLIFRARRKAVSHVGDLDPSGLERRMPELLALDGAAFAAHVRQVRDLQQN